ncbi:hypothetical protein TorRG33x02_231840 [Trema orientale]|uniref:Uncharacterized protein n=1 Tax=Trema orientale TaxID=63057 RepID=A0A2P5E6A8_TREOI|nr:hypothetical protein TorRG33x02_231840 [Trema orientale]
MLSPCEVHQFQAHQAFLSPVPTMDEWRAQRGLTLGGLLQSPSHKRKAQSLVLPIPHPSNMPHWAPKLDFAKLAQAVVVIESCKGAEESSMSSASPLANQTPLSISPGQFTYGSYPIRSRTSSL